MGECEERYKKEFALVACNNYNLYYKVRNKDEAFIFIAQQIDKLSEQNKQQQEEIDMLKKLAGIS